MFLPSLAFSCKNKTESWGGEKQTNKQKPSNTQKTRKKNPQTWSLVPRSPKVWANRSSNSCVNPGLLSACPSCCNSFMQLTFFQAFLLLPPQCVPLHLGHIREHYPKLLFQPLWLSQLLVRFLPCHSLSDSAYALLLICPALFPIASLISFKDFYVLPATAEFGPSSRHRIYLWPLKRYHCFSTEKMEN